MEQRNKCYFWIIEIIVPHLLPMSTPSGLELICACPDSRDIYVLGGLAGDTDGEPLEPGAGGLGDILLTNEKPRFVIRTNQKIVVVTTTTIYGNPRST